MKKGKYENKAVPARKSASVRSLALLLALVLLLGGVIGGTIAWLTDKTNEVKNTFSTSDISIELKETTTEYKMIPGWTIDKDPYVTVKAGSEACWLFVKVTEAGGVVQYTKANGTQATTSWADFLSYEVSDTGVTGKTWTELPAADAGKLNDGEKVYYIDVADLTAKDAAAVTYKILKDDTVSVNQNVTKEMMNALNADTYPTLTFTAYACQYMKNNTQKFTAAEAWQNCPGYVAPATP